MVGGVTWRFWRGVNIVLHASTWSNSSVGIRGPTPNVLGLEHGYFYS